MDSWAFLTPAETPSTSFDPNLLYQFKIAHGAQAGQAEDMVLQFIATGNGPTQTVGMYGPAAPMSCIIHGPNARRNRPV